MVAARRQALREVLAGGGAPGAAGAAAAQTQADIVAALERRGFEANQSTVSRDLRAVGARREHSPDGAARWSLPPLAEAAPPPPPARYPFALVLGVTWNETVVLVKTHVAAASAVANALDAAGIDGLLGTIAGDDTILAVPEHVSRTAALARRIQERVWPGQPRARAGHGRPRPRPGPRARSH